MLIAPLALGAGCAGPPFAAPIEGEPVCADFDMGATPVKMTGSLRFPVRVQILEGKTVLMKLIIDGKRTPDAPPSHTFIIDDSAEYTVEWAQCANERAPSPATDAPKKGAHAPPKKEGGTYECGDAVVYKTDKLVTKKHDVASHKLTFVPPPKPECWVSDAPRTLALPPAEPTVAPSAAPAAPPDAGAEDAGASGDAGATQGKK